MKNKKNPEIIDTSIFDETLKEIDEILNNLEQTSEKNQNQLERLNVLPEVKSAISKIHLAKKELVEEENNLIKDNNLLKRIKKLEENINNSNEFISHTNELKRGSNNEVQEHRIDKDLLSMSELHNLGEINKKKEKSSFSFYNYLILIFAVFFTLYGTLSISKDLIISKYPIAENSIQYFFEIIEIVKITIIGFFTFIKNMI